MVRLKAVILFACGLLFGCVATPEKTPEQPQIIVQGVPHQAIVDALIADKTKKGMQLKSINDYQIVFEKRIENVGMATWLYGSTYDAYPAIRVTYTLVNASDGIQILSHLDMVTNPGSPYEKLTDLTGAQHDTMQSELNDIKASFAIKK